MRSSAPLLKNFFARGLLALALVFAQQTAALHWLSHAIEATHAKAGSGSAPADHCDECVALGALGAAAAGSHATMPADAAHHVLAATLPATDLPAVLRLAYHSRAPPIPS